ncbi:hypothetical protein GCM10008018_56970 [Paenibacillus marchantiophytorum]|uniref:Uncharacterized protein n=1 Tax=Paenibacillus marchantiophytorum TaxID=1619310 RepID=A0ABQ1F908_9BACL|nr:hypothetical protein GCM10008018_56970 [Paenibacillus marchantiophytorum]
MGENDLYLCAYYFVRCAENAIVLFSFVNWLPTSYLLPCPNIGVPFLYRGGDISRGIRASDKL